MTGAPSEKPKDLVKLGSMLFTIVEPDKGYQVAYNRWYERDHFYSGCMIGRWTLAGKRFVATRDCKALRYPAENPFVPAREVGSYLAMYWIMKGHHGDWLSWSVPQVHWLHEQGRMFSERQHTHTQLYRFRWHLSREPDGVPPELALDHAYAGLVAVAVDAPEGGDPAALEAWLREEHLPAALPGSPAALALCFTPMPMGPGGPSDVPQKEGSDRRFLLLHFMDDDPRESWSAHFAKLGEQVAATSLGEVVFASPFLSTVPGTDTYTDQLW